LNETNRLAEIDNNVERFTRLDTLCEKIKERGICDALGVQCNSSCKIYVQKEELLKVLEEVIKVQPSAVPDKTVTIAEADTPEANERSCPSCGQKPAREIAKYCDYCGEEL